MDFHIPDLDLVQTGLAVLLDIDVDWEMCVDVSHLVSVTLGDTDDQVVDESADSSESGDVLAGTVVQFDVDDILLWVREVDGQVVKVLCELAYNSPSTPAPFSPSCGLFIPRGPVTVTSLDLMVTLTVRKSLISVLLVFQCAFPGRLQNLRLPSAIHLRPDGGTLHLPPSGTTNCSLL